MLIYAGCDAVKSYCEDDSFTIVTECIIEHNNIELSFNIITCSINELESTVPLLQREVYS